MRAWRAVCWGGWMPRGFRRALRVHGLSHGSKWVECQVAWHAVAARVMKWVTDSLV